MQNRKASRLTVDDVIDAQERVELAAAAVSRMMVDDPRFDDALEHLSDTIARRTQIERAWTLTAAMAA